MNVIIIQYEVISQLLFIYVFFIFFLIFQIIICTQQSINYICFDTILIIQCQFIFQKFYHFLILQYILQIMVKRSRQFFNQQKQHHHTDNVKKIRRIQQNIIEPYQNKDEFNPQQFIQISSENSNLEQATRSQCKFALECLSQQNIPNNILCRDVQLKLIYNFIMQGTQYNKIGMSEPLLIMGCPGVGKTMTVNLTINKIQKKSFNKRFLSIYINLMNLLSIDDIYTSIFKFIFSDLDIKIKNSLSLSYLNQFFSKGLISSLGPNSYVEEKKHIPKLIIIDEIQYLANSKQKNKQIFYNILDWLKQKQSNLTLIMISNSLNFKHQLDQRIQSRLGNHTISFSPYNSLQMMQIANQRLSSLSIFSVEAINFLVKKIAISSTDIRRMLKIFRWSIEIFQQSDLKIKKQIEYSHVTKAYSRIYSDPKFSYMKDMNDFSKSIILLISLQTINNYDWIGCLSSMVYMKLTIFNQFANRNAYLSSLMNLKQINLINVKEFKSNNVLDHKIMLNIEIDEVIAALQFDEVKFRLIFDALLNGKRKIIDRI